MKKTTCAMLIFACAMAANASSVKVSSFGYDSQDSTRFIQQALDSDVRTIILDRQDGPWITLPLLARSNKKFIVEPGVELVAKRGEFKGKRDYLFTLDGVTNFTLRGGAASTFRMWKCDYQKPPYARSEWRYTLRIVRSANVLVENMRFVESGGDGIVVGVDSRDVTIRNCVCDRNHRQGISVTSCENLLIENTVLSNTDGTPPQAGIDFEPDRPTEKLVNCVMRNCLVENNTGNGYEIYLDKLNSGSAPVSIAFENCRSVGNKISVSICGGRREKDFVKGRVSFSGCSFESGRDRGMRLLALPGSSFDVKFDGCSISNAAPGKTAADINVAPMNIMQGQCDGIDFGDMKIFQPCARPWFHSGMTTFGDSPKRVAGLVAVCGSDGRCDRFAIDPAWVAANLPVVEGGGVLPARQGIAEGAEVEAHDSAPGEMADLQPVALVYGARYVFYVDKPGVVRFAGRQVNVVKGRPLNRKKMTIGGIGMDGKRFDAVQLPIPGETVTEFTYKAKRPGFYRINIPNGGTRFMLVKSSVPIAIDTMEREHIVAPFHMKPFSLWFDVASAGPFVFATAGDSHNAFSIAVKDPAGGTVAGRDLVDDLFFVKGDASSPKGLWQIDFAKTSRPTYDWVRLNVFGTPGYFFLSREKTWKTK